MKLSLKFSLIASLCICALSACIEDSVSTNPAHQPEFSVDTLHLGRVFTAESTPTHKFMVYNRHSEVMSISSIAFKNGGTGFFRLNVDGIAGSSFSNVEIRPNDSIYVFVEATLPPNGQNAPVSVCETVEFLTNGVTTSVILDAQGRDVNRLRAHTLLADTTVTAALPLQIFDSLVVAPGVTLTLAPGAELFFHDGSSLQVHGTLIANGTPQQPVTLGGDRSGWVATNIPYHIMSMQWEGVKFHSSSSANSLSHTIIENTVSGVVLDSLSSGNESVPSLSLINCRLRNSGGYALAAHHSSVSATGCEFAEGANGAVLLRGANHNFTNCTFANYYLFSHISGPIITFLHADDDTSDLSSLPYLRADFGNCIMAGIGGELSHPDLNDTDIYLRRCLMNVSGTDDLHFIDMLWNADPLWLTDRTTYFFDYRLKENSPAIGASLRHSSSSLNPIAPIPLPATDFYGTPHPSPAAVGAMEKL